jgi:hypothetical protein
VRILDSATAGALGLRAAGALLTRPDGREVERWVSFEDAAAATARWSAISAGCAPSPDDRMPPELAGCLPSRSRRGENAVAEA